MNAEKCMYVVVMFFRGRKDTQYELDIHEN